MRSVIKKIYLGILTPTFGSIRFKRFYYHLLHLAFRGLNYRNTDIKTNGEQYFSKKILEYYSTKSPGEKISIFDIGANTGGFAKHLNEVFISNRKIYSFEPFDEAYTELVKLTGTINDFHPQKIGFSDKKEKKIFYSSSAFSEVSGLYAKDYSQFGFELNKSEELQFETVDTYCYEKGIPHINFLKVDVEGHDFFVLKGASEMLKNSKIDFIQFEFGTVNYLSQTHFFDFFNLLSPNYKLAKLLKNGYILIDEYNTDIEIHLLSNYVAVNRKVIENGFQLPKKSF